MKIMIWLLLSAIKGNCQVLTTRNCCRRPGIPCDPQSHCLPEKCIQPKPPAKPPTPDPVKHVPVNSQERNPCEGIPAGYHGKVPDPGPNIPCRCIDPPPKCSFPGGTGFINPCLPISCPNSWTRYKTLFFCMSLPLILLQMIRLWDHHSKTPKKCKNYEYLRLRTKKFPWGDGNTTFFHNPHMNFLPGDCPDCCFECDPCLRSPNMPCSKCGMVHTDLLTVVTIQESSPTDVYQPKKVDSFQNLQQPIRLESYRIVDQPIRVETLQDTEPVHADSFQHSETDQVETLPSPEAPKIELVNVTTEQREEILESTQNQEQSRNKEIPASVKPKETESIKTKMNAPLPKIYTPYEPSGTPKRELLAPITPKSDHSAGFIERSLDGINMFGGLHYGEVHSEEEPKESELAADANVTEPEVYDTAEDVPCFEDARKQFQGLVHAPNDLSSLVENVSCVDPGLTVNEVSGKDCVGKDLAKVETFHTLRIPLESSVENVLSDESGEDLLKHVDLKRNISKDDGNSDAHEEEVVAVHSLHSCPDNVDIASDLAAEEEDKHP